MDAAAPQEGKRRRLPSWMVGVAAAGKLSKGLDDDVNCIVTDDDAGRVSLRGKKVQHAKKPLYKKISLEAEESSFPILKCEKRRSRKEVNRKDSGFDGVAKELVVDKGNCRGLKTEVQEPTRRKKEKPKDYEVADSDEIEFSSADEGDGDLTMEDLMSIAREVVEGDNTRAQQQSPQRDCGEERLNIAPCRNAKGGSLVAPQKDSNGSSIHRETYPSHNEVENMIDKVAIDKPKMTGDPAQDMLDLFLGPLLKKPLVQENKVNLVVEDKTLGYQSKKENLHDFPSSAAIPLTKKKSSLKDKVAMFLD